MSDAILLVDDEAGVVRALERVLREDDYAVHTAASGDAALGMLKTRKFKVIVSDERMPGMSGSEFLSLASLRCPETVRIVLTGHSSLDGAMRAVNDGQIYRFLLKPWNDAEFRMVIRGAVEKFDLERENRKLLALARDQARRLEQAEQRQPGITAVPDHQGRLQLDELSAEEADRLREAYRSP